MFYEINLGRFNRLFFISLPNEKDRLEILQISTRKYPLADDVNLNIVSRMTDGFTGADLQALYQHAYKLFVRESIEKQENTLLQICHNHFEQALKSVRRSITDNDINKHKIFDEILQNKTRNCHHHYHDDDDLYS